MDASTAGYNMENPDKARNAFGTAALVMGIISTVMLCTGVLSIPSGALGVLFAILSRKKGSPLKSNALTGLVLSVTGMVLGSILTAYAVYRLLYDPTVWDQIKTFYPDYYKYMVYDFQEGGGL